MLLGDGSRINRGSLSLSAKVKSLGSPRANYLSAG